MSKPRKRRDFGSLPQNSNIQTSQYVIVRGDEGLAFPSLLTVAASIIVLAIFLPAVHLLSKGLKVQTKLIPIPEPKRGATLSSLVILVSFVAVFLWRVSTHMLQLDTCSHIFSVDPTCPGVVVDVVDVPWLLVLQAPILLGVFVVMKRTGRNIASIGVDRKDWRRMLVLGGTVSAIFVTISGLLAPSLGGGLRRVFCVPCVWAGFLCNSRLQRGNSLERLCSDEADRLFGQAGGAGNFLVAFRRPVAFPI